MRIPHSSERAMTLVEVMLAVVLGSAVVTVVSVVAVDSVAIRKSSEAALRNRWEQVRVFDQFEEDVNGMITWMPDAIETIKFPTQPDQLIEIVTLASMPRSDSPFRRRLPARVSYRLREMPGRDVGKELVRTIYDLTQEQTASAEWNEVLADNLTHATVEVNIGKTWKTNLSRSDSPEVQPRAVRLTCLWRGASQRGVTRTILIEGEDDEVRH